MSENRVTEPPITHDPIAFLGLGAMGSMIAARLITVGYPVTVWNRSPEVSEAFARSGARVAASPSAAVHDADVVCVMLPDAQAVADVVLGPAGAVSSARPGAAIIDLSTIGPSSVQSLAARLPSGISYLDAPVLGSVAEAAAGTLTLLVGGDEATFRRCRSVMAAIGHPRRVGHTGAGAAAKLVANSALLASMVALGEAVALADALGLDRSVTYEVLAATPLATQADKRRPILDGHPAQRRFALRHALKDAGLICTEASRAGAPLLVAAATRSWFARGLNDGLGDNDYTDVLATIASASVRRRVPRGD